MNQKNSFLQLYGRFLCIKKSLAHRTLQTSADTKVYQIIHTHTHTQILCTYANMRVQIHTRTTYT